MSIECKSYKKAKSIILTRSNYEKHRLQAVNRGQTPIWVQESENIGPTVLISLADFYDIITENRRLRRIDTEEEYRQISLTEE